MKKADFSYRNALQNMNVERQEGRKLKLTIPMPRDDCFGGKATEMVFGENSQISSITIRFANAEGMSLFAARCGFSITGEHEDLFHLGDVVVGEVVTPLFHLDYPPSIEAQKAQLIQTGRLTEDGRLVEDPLLEKGLRECLSTEFFETFFETPLAGIADVQLQAIKGKRIPIRALITKIVHFEIAPLFLFAQQEDMMQVLANMHNYFEHPTELFNLVIELDPEVTALEEDDLDERGDEAVLMGQHTIIRMVTDLLIDKFGYDNIGPSPDNPSKLRQIFTSKYSHIALYGCEQHLQAKLDHMVESCGPLVKEQVDALKKRYENECQTAHIRGRSVVNSNLSSSPFGVFASSATAQVDPRGEGRQSPEEEEEGEIAQQQLGRDLCVFEDCPMFPAGYSTQEESAPNKVIIAGEHCTFLITKAKKVLTYGDTGNVMMTPLRTPLNLLKRQENVEEVSIGSTCVLLRTGTGEVWGAGIVKHGLQAPRGLFDPPPYEQITDLPPNITAMSAAKTHSLFLTSEGEVWGRGSVKPLGFGRVDDPTPFRLQIGSQPKKIKAISAGGSHSLFLTYEGEVFVCGFGMYGELGLGDGTMRAPLPVQIIALPPNIKAIYAGKNQSFFLTDDGDVWACGYGNNGQLGIGTKVMRQLLPVQITTFTVKITDIALGGEHTLFLTAGGEVLGCGSGKLGRLGTGTEDCQLVPVPIISHITEIAAGYAHSLFLTSTGILYACGVGGDDRLGFKTDTIQLRPVEVPGIRMTDASVKPFRSNLLARSRDKDFVDVEVVTNYY